MTNLVPDSYGALREYNSCHDERGRFCSGSSRDAALDPPAVGKRIGFVTPQGVDKVRRHTGGLGGYSEDHTDMARRLLHDAYRIDRYEGGVSQALKAGYIRYWVREGELALHFRGGNEATAKNALKFLKDNYTHGDRIYMDIEGPEGLELGKFFDNLRLANETIRLSVRGKQRA